MKVTLGNIKTAEEALKKLLNMDLPIKSSFVLGKLVKEVNAELAHFEDERIKLVKKMGTEDGEGNFNVTQEKAGEFMSAYSELSDIEVELNYEPVSADDLGDIFMTAVEMASLSEFVK
jgi:hypothetical protein